MPSPITPEHAQDRVIVCGRVGCHDVRVSPGARIGECSQCKTAIWISLSSESVSKQGGFAYFCQECIRPLMREAAKRDNLTVAAIGSMEQLAKTTARLLKEDV